MLIGQCDTEASTENTRWCLHRSYNNWSKILVVATSEREPTWVSAARTSRPLATAPWIEAMLLLILVLVLLWVLLMLVIVLAAPGVSTVLSVMLMVLVMMAFETSTVLGMLGLMGLKVVLLLMMMSMPTAGIHVAVRVSSELLNSAVSMPV